MERGLADTKKQTCRPQRRFVYLMYNKVCVAGTFAGLHRGHEAVLTAAFSAGEQVMIGLTTDAYVRKYKTSPISPLSPIRPIPSFRQRKLTLVRWLSEQGYLRRAHILPLNDPFGPAVSASFDALIVTPENRARGKEINRLRSRQGIKPLALLEVPLVRARDGRPISTTRVNQGEIDPHGKLILPDSLRPELRKPIGKLLVGEDIAASLQNNRQKILIAVGDITVKTLWDAGVTPALAVIDHQVARRPYPGLRSYRQTFLRYSRKISVKSGPGYLSREALAVVKEWSAKLEPWLLEIDGEEDLLTLPAILYAPVGTVVYYGQPGGGLVEVGISPRKKQLAAQLLRKFTHSTNRKR